jgi:two-component system response regulator BaeR
MNGLVLIVEDETSSAEIVAEYLQRERFSTCILTDGAEVVSWVLDNSPSLILLDLMLPGKGGLDICREIRRHSTVPIVMVTALAEEIDRLLGLELGADDYICKPYSPREVVARVKTVLRRAGTVISAGSSDLSLDQFKYRATIKGRDLQLTVAEFRLLSFLAAHPGRVYNRQQLLDGTYPDERALNDRAIDNHIKNLRKKMSQLLPEVELIHSVYGIGYKFEIQDK